MSQKGSEHWGWQQSLLLAVGTAAMLGYLAIKVVNDGLRPMPITLSFVGGLLLSASILIASRRRGEVKARSPWILQIALGAGVVWGYLAVTAFEELPTTVKGASIAALLGVSAGAGVAALAADRRKAGNGNDPHGQ